MTIRQCIILDDIEEFQKKSLRLDQSMVLFLKKNAKEKIKQFIANDFLKNCFLNKKIDTLKIMLQSHLVKEKDLMIILSLPEVIDLLLTSERLKKFFYFMNYFALQNNYRQLLCFLKKTKIHDLINPQSTCLNVLNMATINHGMKSMTIFKKIYNYFKKQYIELIPVILDKNHFGQKILTYLIESSKFKKDLNSYWKKSSNWHNFFGMTIEQRFFHNPSVLNANLLKLFWYFHKNISTVETFSQISHFLYSKIKEKPHFNFHADLNFAFKEMFDLVENDKIIQSLNIADNMERKKSKKI